MLAKTEWYEEILALEPGSKIFLPFARALAGEGQYDKAVQILRHGLGLHPEHAEARVFLLHLLSERGDMVTARDEARQLAALFEVYPGFWDALSALKAAEGDAETALLLRFVAAAAHGHAVPLVQALARGLDGTSAGAPDFPGVVAPDPAGAAARPAMPALDEPDALDEPVSLRTRSMAEILAEQGDVPGALAIYQELAAAAPDDATLAARITELQNRPAAGVFAGAEGGDGADCAAEAVSPAGVPDKGAGLKRMLAELAERLDARADGC